ncbi:MAG: TIGR02281 family clan AA aspartic protease [Proteobacteria bacterium]|nr:TIGR02281 family clan AA aspartic protease [Pseudomonadota bacterium]
MRPRLLIYLAATAAVGGLIYALIERYPDALQTEHDVAHLVRAILVLGLVSTGLIWLPRTRWRKSAGAFVSWIFIGVLVFMGYAVKDDLGDFGRRLAGTIVPSIPVSEDGGRVSFRRGDDGHFRIEADINGRRLRLLVDTGASVVVLSQGDAVRAGIDVAKLSFTQQVRTANGLAMAAPIRIANITIGPIVVEDVRASVGGPGMSGSLLGMSFLERLSAFEIRGDKLVLRP